MDLKAGLRLACCIVVLSGFSGGALAQRSLTLPVVTIISKGGGMGIEDDQVTIVSRVIGATAGSALSGVYIAEQRRNNRAINKRTVDHRFIDSRTCPALATSLAKIDSLPPMRFASPKKQAETGGAFDVPLTTLRTAPADEGGVGVRVSRSEFLGPVATWRLQFEADLEGCWQSEAVVIPGVSVIERLSTEADAKTWSAGF